MPRVIWSRSDVMNLNRKGRWDTLDLDYSYPNRLDWHPNSDLHRSVLTKLLTFAANSQEVMSRKWDTWREIDRTLTAYVDLSIDEQDVLAKDKRKPVSIVIPVSYATMETILTYWASVFLTDPLFSYEGTGPEDVRGAALLETDIRNQAIRSRMALNLHTQFRDSIAYGIGASAFFWYEKYGKVPRRQSMLQSILAKVGMPGDLYEDGLLYAGNEMRNIDPYSFLPDPDMPIQEFQRGRFVGWVTRTNYMALLDEESTSDGDVFNVKYIDNNVFTSIFNSADESDREARLGYTDRMTEGTVDLMYMFVNLIPKEWELGSKTSPEKWMFVVAGDDLIVQARPIGSFHNMYPLTICSPDYDGYSITPTSKLEVVYGLQSAIDSLWSMHITNVRKALNDMIVYDPMLICTDDLTDPKPGKLIRLRRQAWGKGIKDAIQQLQVTDVTQGNISDMMVLMQMVQQVTAATDSLQGILNQSGPDRRTATEFSNTMQSAMSRLGKGAKVGSAMCMYDAAYIVASHTQQYRTEEGFLKVVGKAAEVLGMQPGTMVPVSPMDLAVGFDVVPNDATMKSGESLSNWVNIFQIIASRPELSQVFDIVKIFEHIAKVSGVKNIDDFKAVMGVSPRVVSDETVMKQREMGNMVPMNEYAASQGFGSEIPDASMSGMQGIGGF